MENKAYSFLTETVFKKIKTGRLCVVDANGNTQFFGDGTGPRVKVKFNDPSTYLKLLTNPSFHLGEAYMNQAFELEEGTLSDFFDIVLGNLGSEAETPQWQKIIEGFNFVFRPLQQLNTLSTSRKNVSHHYDLSKELYDMFLDDHRQYSCAYFRSEKDTLETAQKNKMQHILSKLLVKRDHHVLDIGCGWGGLARFIARKTRARVTGITLSEEQFNYARKKTREEGLSNLVDFKLCDYRELQGSFDRIVSVGMFEHVGVRYYDKFFKTIRNLLQPHGVALLHSIGKSAGPSVTNPWIRKYIFPGGYIPALSEVMPNIENNGLHITDIEILRLHYAKTLREWQTRFAKSRGQASRLYDDRFCRMWEFYLAVSEASFKYLGNMVFQIQLSRDVQSVPLTRNYLYK
jgi:cyclopropane-fatty-acyl-phospholipid synthase